MPNDLYDEIIQALLTRQGISELLERIIDKAVYEGAHPSIPNTVLNYDSIITGVIDEPDCYPHPFDVMAVWSIYQMAK